METHRQSVVAPAPRAVFDCMVFLQGAARRNGPAARCLRMAEQGHVSLLLSVAILNEIKDVLGRPAALRKFPELADILLPRRLEEWRHAGIMIETVPPTLRLVADAKDEKYLNLAIAGNADFLVSWDKHLLALRSDATPEGLAFPEACPTTRIVTPVEFLQAISASVR